MNKKYSLFGVETIDALEFSLNKYNFFIVTLLGVIFSGCGSTSADKDKNFISKVDNVIKYKSRCGFHDSNTSSKIQRETFYPTQAAKYPSRAAKRGVEGYVKLEYNVTPSGIPVSIRIIESYPSDTFNEVALKSFSEWRYMAKALECESLQLDFTLG